MRLVCSGGKGIGVVELKTGGMRGIWGCVKARDEWLSEKV